MSDSKATYTGRSLRSLLAEGVVIVASILMAFSIDAWWDERQEEDKRQRILGQVREELVLYREIVPQAIARADTAIAASETLLAVAHGHTEPEAVELHQALHDVSAQFSFGAAAPVFQTLAGSGGFSLVPDPALRQAISDIMAFSSLTAEFEDAEGYQVRAYKTYLGHHYDRYGGALAIERPHAEHLPPTGFEQQLLFLDDLQFSNLLFERRLRAMRVNHFRRELLGHVETAIALLDQYAGPN